MEDVVIAGGGPNGLMLACELALAGVRPIVLEKLTAPRTEQRANGLVGQVVRMMDRRGLFERLTGTVGPPRPAPQFMFAAYPMPFGDLADNPVYTVLVPQRKVEEVLAERATELGAEIRRGYELVGLSEVDDGVTVELDGPAGRETLRTRYLVGADGGHSATRKLAGIEFPGITNDRTVSRGAHVRVADEFRDQVTGGLVVPGYGVIPPFLHTRTENGMVSFAQFPDGRVLLNVSERADVDESQPMTFEELRGAFLRVVGVEAPVEELPTPGMMRRTVGGNTRLADRYRVGRVLLVGDAAHVHSAISGSGLNLGLQDSINLAWKLAAEILGWAPPGLLDTYESERKPAGLRVTMHTMAQSVLVGPGPEVTALRTLFGELLGDRATVQRIANLLSGADVAYAGVSRWAPDLTVDGRRLAELTRTARPLLLDLTADGRLAGVAAPWRDRVDVVTGRGGVPRRPGCCCAPTATSPGNPWRYNRIAPASRPRSPSGSGRLTVDREQLFLYRVLLATRTRRPSPQTIAVLRDLAEDPENWRHRYDLCTELGIPAGSMYPILIRLADRGFLETSWEAERVAGWPARHLYRLSDAEREYAATHPGEAPAARKAPRATTHLRSA